MGIPIFMSYPKPFLSAQQGLVDSIKKQLALRGLEPRTLGVNEYDNEVPLRTVRRLLLESNGVLSLGLRRYYVKAGQSKPTSDAAASLDERWFTSPWPHMETAMGYQLGLPILLVREAGVQGDGVLEKGVIDVYVPEVDVQNAETFLESQQWTHLVGSWERDVRTVAKNRGMPPKLY